MLWRPTNSVTAGGRGLVVDTTGIAMVTRGITEGREFVTGMLGWGVDGGRGAMHLGGEGKNAKLTMY